MPSPVDNSVTVHAISEALKDFFDCCKDITIEKEIQQTERTRIREYARICISQIEADTQRFELALEEARSERETYIAYISKVLMMDKIDENCLALCKMFIEALDRKDPLKLVSFSDVTNFNRLRG